MSLSIISGYYQVLFTPASTYRSLFINQFFTAVAVVHLVLKFLSLKPQKLGEFL